MCAQCDFSKHSGIFTLGNSHPLIVTLYSLWRSMMVLKKKGGKGGREGGRKRGKGGRERLRRNREKERKERRVRWNEGEHQNEGLPAEEAERG